MKRGNGVIAVGGLLALLGLLTSAAPAGAAVNLGNLGIDQGPILIDGGGVIVEPPPPPPPPAPPTVSQLEGNGYLCEAGVLAATECRRCLDEPVSGDQVCSLYTCDTPHACENLSTRFLPGSVPSERFDLWAPEFARLASDRVLADVDGDGRDDLIAFGRGPTAPLEVLRSSGDLHYRDPEIWRVGFCAAGDVCTTGDLSGDGRADVIAFRPGGAVVVARSSGSQFISARTWNDQLGAVGDDFLVGDLNGDGRDDVVALASAAGIGQPGDARVLLTQPPPTRFDPLTFPAGPGTLWRTQVCPTPERCHLGDVTGDGRADLVRVDGAQVRLFPSTGAAFGSGAIISQTFGAAGEQFFLRDVNGDGRVDMLAIGADGFLTVGISSGAALIAEVFDDRVYCDGDLRCAFGDVNGDRRPDLLELAFHAGGGITLGHVWATTWAGARGFPLVPDLPPGPDADGDGTPDAFDNCTEVANANQVDADGDGIGNQCDGDFNQDGTIGGPDFDVFLQCVNRPVGPGGPADDPECRESDLNGDGFVGGPDFDLFIGLFNQPPGASALTGPPRVRVFSPRHGEFFDGESSFAFVLGAVENAPLSDLRVTVNGEEAAVAADGSFSVFVPLDAERVFQPLLVVAERESSGLRAQLRRVVLLGDSRPMNESAPLAMGARIHELALDDILGALQETIEGAVSGIDPATMSTYDRTIHTLDIDSASVDVFAQAEGIFVRIAMPSLAFTFTKRGGAFEPTCSGSADVQNLTISMLWDIEPKPLYPGQLRVRDVQAPTLTYSTLDTSIDGKLCSALAAIFKDVPQEVRDGLVGAFAAPSFVSALLLDALHGFDPNGSVPDSVPASFDLAFQDFLEDTLGGTLLMGLRTNPELLNFPDELFEAFAFAPGVAASLPLFGAGPERVLAPGPASFGPWPALTDEGLYELGLEVSPDALNQLLATVSAAGLANRVVADRDGQPIAALEFCLFFIPATEVIRCNDPRPVELRFTMGIAPVVSGRAGPNGEMLDVRVGQMLLDLVAIDPDAGTEEHLARLAVDARVGVDVEIDAFGKLRLVPRPPGEDQGTVIQELVVLNGIAPVLQFSLDQFADQLEAGLLAFLAEPLLTFQTPAFAGLQLEGVHAERTSGGTVRLFANLIPEQPPFQPPFVVGSPPGGTVLLGP